MVVGVKPTHRGGVCSGGWGRGDNQSRGDHWTATAHDSGAAVSRQVGRLDAWVEFVWATAKPEV